ncbi:hypothetical protein SLEP1_g51643 [Rubroshorea leprosula]|uniref:Uncharacterized protein n=1 Tax=Rubroshorea leprosula TaxID=152421 RepID=A0AAV5M4K6_9ROSI|nr:hypothetical protein SLEP1_g51643 [Rubroshorea leprosula]
MGDNPASVLANFGSAVTVHVGATVHRHCSPVTVHTPRASI